ncbi:MAG: type II toxin-antitoxin system VapC family toxin [Chthoniobacterales bacterium]
MKVLVDSDVLLDIALDRQPFFASSNAALEWCRQHPGSAVMAWHTVANVYYLLRRAETDAVARKFISELLVFVAVARSDTRAVLHAFTLRIADFEDSLQAAAAIFEDAPLIVTRNIRDYRHSPVLAIEPETLVARYG